MTSVSAIVAARNEEANIERAVRSLAAQPEIAEIIVVNDQSTDATGAILQKLSAEFPQLRVLETSSLPDGWVGKNYAVWLGAQQAQQPWLLLTDADTTHLPDSTRRALEDEEKHTADLVSYSPEQETPTWWERAMIPFVYCRLARHFPYGRLDDRYAPPAANGQYILVRREAYFTIGGHQSIAGEVLEDVALARRARRAGFKIYFARGDGIARTRMYTSFGAMWAGWKKNLYPLIGGSLPALFRELLSVSPWVPLPVFALASWKGWLRLYWVGGGVLILLFALERYRAQLRENRYPASSILYYVPALFLYSAALVASALAHARGRVVWKGREYPVGTK